MKATVTSAAIFSHPVPVPVPWCCRTRHWYGAVLVAVFELPRVLGAVLSRKWGDDWYVYPGLLAAAAFATGLPYMAAWYVIKHDGARVEQVIVNSPGAVQVGGSTTLSTPTPAPEQSSTTWCLNATCTSRMVLRSYVNGSTVETVLPGGSP